MDKFLYKLELADFDLQGMDLIEKKKKIISSLNLNDQEKKRLLASHSKLIKNLIDYKTAIHYKNILDRLGIKCNITRNILNDYDMKNPVAITHADHMALNAIKTVFCTKCNKEQPETRECIYCGFLIKEGVDKIKNQQTKLKKSKPSQCNAHQSPAISNLSTFTREELKQYIHPAQEPKRAFFKKLFRKSKRIGTNIHRIIIILGLTILLCTILLYFCKLLWLMYQMTPVGSYYVVHYVEKTEPINRLLGRNFLIFSFRISVSALVICMLVGIISRFLYIHQYLYKSRGMIGKLLFWALPLSMLVAYYLQTVFIHDPWSMIFIYASVPTFCIFSYCFDFVELIIPELRDVFKFLIALKDKLVRRVKQLMLH
ncbi:MAG: hypothetical protein SWH54_13140 [Thermodesulfobacteriota bacterium]|nr:hypothetical protein [Thermodesulfobacteriota bacterium]